MRWEDLFKAWVDERNAHRDWYKWQLRIADSWDREYRRRQDEWKALWVDDLTDFVMVGSSPCSPFTTPPIVYKNGKGIDVGPEHEIDCSFLDELL